jgi:hypothetical protein
VSVKAGPALADSAQLTRLLALQRRHEEDDETMDQTNDAPTDIDSLSKAYADLNERNDELEAIVDRYARIMALYGLDFTDTDRIVVVERVLAVARLGEDAVRRLEGRRRGGG